MIILHGENIVASRKRLTNELEKFSGEKIRLESSNLTLTEAKQALESASLFGQDKLVVIESLFSGRPSKKKETLLDYLKSEQPKNLIIWEGKAIDGRKLVSFQKSKIENFKLTAVIFKFLDSLGSSKKISLGFLHQVINQESPEMVFYMLVRRISLLLIAKDLGPKGLQKMADWQKSRLVAQAKRFSLNQLLKCHRQLLEIDYQQKTGQSVTPLNSSIDLLVVSL